MNAALQSLYRWTLERAAAKQARSALALVAFSESFVFPIPPDAMLIPMALAQPKRAFTFAAIATVASVAGGLVGYLIGALFYDSVGRLIIELYNLEESFAEFAQLYRRYDLLLVFAAGFTLLPYKLFTIAAGVAFLNPATFVLASLASRGARFFLVAAVFHYGGPGLRAFVERRLMLLGGLALVLLIAGFLLITVVADA